MKKNCTEMSVDERARKQREIVDEMGTIRAAMRMRKGDKSRIRFIVYESNSCNGKMLPTDLPSLKQFEREFEHELNQRLRILNEQLTALENHTPYIFTVKS